jgi:hypothetical protein
MGIDAIVDKCPRYTAGIEWKADVPIDGTAHSGPAQEGSPIESKTFDDVTKTGVTRT